MWASLKLMSSEVAKAPAPTVSGQPEGNTAACDNIASTLRPCGVVDPTFLDQKQANRPDVFGSKLIRLPKCLARPTSPAFRRLTRQVSSKPPPQATAPWRPKH
jgi:hypothetical protein